MAEAAYDTMEDARKPSKDKLRKIHEEALARFDKAKDAETENRRIAEEDYLFASGDEQWPESIRKERETEGRPCLTINRLPQFIRQVMGDARQNKPGIKVRPVEDSDEESAETYEGLIRAIETSSNAEQSYMTALEHALTGGFGNWRILTEYKDNRSFDQDIKIAPIRNPFAVFWDPGSKQYDRADANWCFVTEWMAKEEFDRRYPKANDSDWESDLEISQYEGWIDDQDRVRVAEYWVKERIERKLYMVDDVIFVDELPEDVSPENARSRTIYDTKIVRYLMSGEKVLDGPKQWAGKYIPIVPVWGPEEFVGGRHRYLSLIRHAKDPQRLFNYWQSTITEKVALAPKSPWLITTKQVAGLEQFWNSANTANLPYLPYNPDPQSRTPPNRNAPAPLNQAELAQAAQSIDDMKATTGIYDASLGARGNETSGLAIRQREMQGDTSTYSWIDNLARSIEHTGRILVDLIPKIYDTTRVVEILGEDDSTEKVELNKPEIADAATGQVKYRNDLSIGKYDVRVQVGPSYNTQRQEAADSMMGFIKAYPQAAQLVGDLIAKNMDWPGADEIAERLKKANPLAMAEDPEYQQQVQQQQEQQAQQEQEDRQIQMRDMMADIEKKHAEAQKTLGEIDQQKAEVMETLAKVHEIEENIRAQELENQNIDYDGAKTTVSSGP